ncbi:MAG: transglutaminase-like domain-containing protein, partial [Clostridia bacterium]|nr:transglutaminase-like domain-containing protein [Clostridia bacterium]
MSRGAPAGAGAPKTQRWPELLLHAAAMLLAMLGFLFSLITSYGLTVLTARALLAAVASAALFLAVYSARRSGLLLIVCIVALELWLCLRASDLMQGLLALLEQALASLDLILPPFLLNIYAPQDAESALRLSTLALQTLMFLLGPFAGFCVVRRHSAAWLAVCTLPLLVPAPFYGLAPATLPFFCLVAAYLMLYIAGSGRRMPITAASGRLKPRLTCREQVKTAQQSARVRLSLAAIPLIACAALLSVWILPESDYERPEAIDRLQQSLLDLELVDLLQRSNDGLTHGDLRNLSDIRYTGDVALKIRVSEERALYLRGFAGARFSGRVWDGAASAVYNRYAESFASVPPQNLYAAAATLDGAPASSYTLSVQTLAAQRSAMFIPAGLLTQASAIDGASYVQDTALRGARGGTYTLEAIPCEFSLPSIPLTEGEASVLSAYLSAAGSALRLPDASGAGAQQTRAAAEAYMEYVFEVYTALPEDTRLAAEALCAAYRLSLQQQGGYLDIYETCRALHNVFSAYCSYSYSPPTIPSDADFSTYFLNESRSGYCVHFATAATVLLRALGLP